jgi:hypothetical protein
MWVDPLEASPPWPGIPRFWDVSRAVAEAYAAGEPLRLALYSPDWPFHSGKYFFSSDIGGDGSGRPTLDVAWGAPVATLIKRVSPEVSFYGDTLTYTLGLLGNGMTLTLTDLLPEGVGVPSELTWQGTPKALVYDAEAHRLTWHGEPGIGDPVTLTYRVSVMTHEPAVLLNAATLSASYGMVQDAEVLAFVNAYRLLLPCILRTP